MTTYDFIFSEKKQNQYYRHIAFWLTWYICIGFMKHHSGYPDSSFWRGLSSTTFTLFLIEVAYTYTIFYWFFPAYLAKKKYGSFIIALSGLTMVAYAFSGLVAFGAGLRECPFEVGP